MTIFEERYAQLNPKQKEAVDTIEGPVMVIAGPGTGKTTILTLRIANILQTTDTPASGILAITFTEQGAKHMRAKLREVIGARANEVRIHTFHGFASSVIAEFHEHFAHLDNFKPISDVESEALIRKLIEAQEFSPIRPIGAPDFYLSSIIYTISNAKREALSPVEIGDFAKKEIERIKKDEDSISNRGASKGELKADAKKKIEKFEKTILFSKVYGQYEEEKREAKVMDYDDIIFELVLAFGRDELLLRLIQEKFLYLLIDEHQDTNDAQNLIIKLIADFFESPNVFIVGDEKQAIFRFQGASVENFLKFEKVWSGMKTISLTHNYRSHQAILDASFSMIENNYSEEEYSHLRTPLVSGAKHIKKPIQITNATSVTDAEHFLFEEIKKLQVYKDDHYTVAVIVKKNKEVDRLVAMAERLGVPLVAERSVDIFSHPIGALFFSLLDVVQDPLDTEALGKTIVSGLWDFDFKTAVAALKELKKGNVEDRLLHSLYKTLSKLQRDKLSDSPLSFVINLAQVSGFHKLLVKDPLYVEVWRGIVDLVQKIIKQGDIVNMDALCKVLKDYRLSAEKKFIKMTVGGGEGNIRVMTAHGSKGLEFDYVFIPYATEESWLSGKKGSSFILPVVGKVSEDDEIRDARRLFYVALTRAKKHATVIVPTGDAGGETLEPLRFLEEIDARFVVRNVAPIADEIEALQHVPEIADTKLVDYAKEVISEKGLSVTALNHFLSCPQTFLFQSILKLPQAPHPSAEKGNAMHLACDRIWKTPEDERSEKKILETIHQAIVDSVSASLLPKFEKELVIKELNKNAPAVAKSLTPHFHTTGKVSSENWSECEYISSYEGTKVLVRLHGKLDAVIDQGEATLVFDYKTKKKMSENEIKGETKNSDGGYFRQLVFYNMLLVDRKTHIIPSLIFLTPDDKGMCHIQSLEIIPNDIESLKKNIDELVESIWSGKIINSYCEEEKCEWCAFSKMLK